MTQELQDLLDNGIDESIFDIFKAKEERAHLKAKAGQGKENVKAREKAEQDFLKTGKWVDPVGGDIEQAGLNARMGSLVDDLREKFSKLQTEWETKLKKNFGTDATKYPTEIQPLVGIINQAFGEIKNFKPQVPAEKPAEMGAETPEKSETPKKEGEAGGEFQDELKLGLKNMKFTPDEISSVLSQPSVTNAKTLEDKFREALKLLQK